MSDFITLQDRVLDSTLRGGDGNRDQIKQHLNDAIRKVDALLRPELTSSVETLTAGQGDYSLATLWLTDVTSIRHIAYTPISGAGPYPLSEVTANAIRDLRRDQGVSTLVYLYALDGLDTLLIYPLSTEVGDTITITYVPRPLELVSDTDTPTGLPPEWHDLYELSAIEASMRPQSPEYSLMYGQMFDKRLGDYRKWRNRRAGTLGRQVLVGRYRRSRRPHDNSTDLGMR